MAFCIYRSTEISNLKDQKNKVNDLLLAESYLKRTSTLSDQPSVAAIGGAGLAPIHLF